MGERHSRSATRRGVKRRKRQKVLRFFLVMILIILIVSLGAFVYRLGFFNDFVENYITGTTPEPTPRPTPENVDEAQGHLPEQNLPQTDDDIINVLLVGLDTRSEDEFERGLADVIMLVSVNTTTNEIKMVSAMRDMLVEVPWGDYDKINSYTSHDAGVEGLMDVFSSHLSVPIDHYATTNFSGLATIIDILGGVTVDVSAKELTVVNNEVIYLNKVDKQNPESEGLTQTGVQVLNGKQAVAYARIRSIDGDHVRTSRQREVLTGLKDNISQLSISQVLELMQRMPEYLKTDMNIAEMLELAPELYKARNASMESLTLPVEGLEKQGRYEGKYVLRWDYELNTQELLKFLYGIEPEVSIE